MDQNTAVQKDFELIRQAVARLWALPAPEPENVLAHPLFTDLQSACLAAFPQIGKGFALTFALNNAVRSLGLPCSVAAVRPGFETTSEVAADGLLVALQQKEVQRVHLCPLDLAGDGLPDIEFGSCMVRTFQVGELADLFGSETLARRLPRVNLDLARLSQFTWLCVREVVPVDGEPGQQALPFMYQGIDVDFGRIEPHSNKLQQPVEDALFFLLLAPWEEWADMPDVDWRPFRTPWTYTADSGIFGHKVMPPSPDTLSWETKISYDSEGCEYEIEVPVELPLKDNVQDAKGMLSDSAWQSLKSALASPLFDTPVAHFLVRGFVTTGIDEFLAHITVVEAALGLECDYMKSAATLSDPKPGLPVTKRMIARVSALLGSKAEGESYKQLFDLRSAFLHGRSMRTIPSTERIRARTLARSVVCALIRVALQPQPPTSREQFAQDLLAQGLLMKP